MTVTPIPVLVLPFVVLFRIHTISLVLLGQVTTVRAVFMVIPVMVVIVVPIIDSELDADGLGLGGSHN